MTINNVIEKTMRIHPDAISDDVKAFWISELDGKIMRETMQKKDSVSYAFPEDGDKELLAKAPYDNIYELYVIAMSDFYSGDIVSYSASSVMFEKAFDDFKKNYIRENIPKSSRGVIL